MNIPTTLENWSTVTYRAMQVVLLVNVYKKTTPKKTDMVLFWEDRKNLLCDASCFLQKKRASFFFRCKP